MPHRGREFTDVPLGRTYPIACALVETQGSAAHREILIYRREVLQMFLSPWLLFGQAALENSDGS